MSVRVFLIAITVLQLGSIAAAGAPKESFKSGVWKGLSETNRHTNRFTGCIIYVSYKNKISMYFRKTRQADLVFGLHHPKWNLDTSKTEQIVINVDGEEFGKFMSRPINTKRFMVTLGSDAWITQRLSKGRVMRVLGPQGSSTFQLYDLGPALSRTRECVDRQLAREHSSNNSLSRSPERPTNNRETGDYQKPRSRSKARNVGREAWELFAMVAMGEEAKIISVEPRLRKFGFEQSWKGDGIRGYAGRWKRAGSIDITETRAMAVVGGICENYTKIAQKSARSPGLELRSTIASCRINQEIKYIATTISRTPKIDSLIFHIGGESKADELQSINDRVLAFLRGIRKKQ